MKKEEDNNLGVTSVILGAVGIAFTLFTAYGFIVGLVFGIIGILLANKQKKLSKNPWCKTGKILGIISIVLVVLTFIAFIWLSKHPEILAQLIPTQ